MTTINNYSVSLSLEAGQYIKQSSLSRTETNRLRRAIEGARTPLEKYQIGLTRLEKALQEGAIDEKLFNRLQEEQWVKLQKTRTAIDAKTHAVVRYTSELERSNQAQRRHSDSLGTGGGATATGGGASGMIKQVASVALAYGGAGRAVRFFSDGLKTSMDRESAAITLRVLTKSQDVASKLVRDVRQFAEQTPFQFGEVLEATQLFIAFGGSADAAIGKLKRFGDIAAATNSNFVELVREISKMSNQAAIYSQDLNQLTGRGINVLPGLARRLGVSVGEVKKQAEKGVITFRMLDEVLTDLANKDFAGVMAERAKTLEGAWSNYNDRLAETKRLYAELFGLGSGQNSMLQQFGKGLAFPVMALSGENALALAESKAQAQADALTLAQIRNRKGGRVNTRGMDERIRKRQFDQFMRNIVPFVDKQLNISEKIQAIPGGAQMAGQGLLGGFQQLGMSIADSFKFNTDRVIQSQEMKLAPAFEVGTQEAYTAMIEAQNNRARAEAGTLEKKQEKQVSLLESISGKAARQTTLLEEQLAIWRDSGPFKKAR